MRSITAFVAAASLTAALAACGGATTPKPSSMKASFLYDGSTRITATTTAGPASIEISATLFPKTFNGTEGLYAHEGPNYPKSYAEAVEVVRNASMPYAELLKQCAASHTEIVIQASGQTLTDQQLSANLEAVLNCAYEDFSIKPYWIPQLIDDVDVCAVVLGEDWRLPTEADLAAFSDPAREAFAEASRIEISLNGGLDVYARGADGQLRRGSMEPGVHSLSAIEYPLGRDAQYHYEGCGFSGCNGRTIGLRCMRTGDVIP
jgi:hypothetical protein